MCFALTKFQQAFLTYFASMLFNQKGSEILDRYSESIKIMEYVES